MFISGTTVSIEFIYEPLMHEPLMHILIYMHEEPYLLDLSNAIDRLPISILVVFYHSIPFVELAELTLGVVFHPTLTSRHSSAD